MHSFTIGSAVLPTTYPPCRSLHNNERNNFNICKTFSSDFTEGLSDNFEFCKNNLDVLKFAHIVLPPPTQPPLILGLLETALD